MAPLVINDAAEVIAIMTILSLPVILSYPLAHVIVSQTPIAVGR
jgi:hypothetical protein